MRNEVFEAAHNAYKTYLDEMIADDSEQNKALHEGAVKSRDGIESPETEIFEKNVQDKIEERIRADYTELIQEGDLNIIIKESQAAFQ